MTVDLSHLKADFPILQREINGNPLIYLDSANTTQKPIQVIDAISDYYKTTNANVLRGAYRLSDEATTAYEHARSTIARFIDAESSSEVIFTRGTTSAINTVAYAWGLNELSEGDRIVVTVMEHHSNIVPWQLICRYTGAELVYLEIDEDYRLDLTTLDEILDERVKIVAVSGMSNVLGTAPPVRQIADAAHAVGAIVVVDGAQLVPHMPVSVRELGADFLAFSSHKMLGPTGFGVLWGRREVLERMEPMEGGGEMIVDVGRHESRWAQPPHKFEAGTPPIAQAIGLGAAIDYLEKIGMDTVRQHEIDITRYALESLANVPDLRVFGPSDLENRGGTVSFALGDIHAHDLATILDEHGVAVRAGHHCAKPLMKTLDVISTARASFYIYTERADIDVLVAGLHEARQVFGLA